jgi:hypothetical protein
MEYKIMKCKKYVYFTILILFGCSKSVYAQDKIFECTGAYGNELTFLHSVTESNTPTAVELNLHNIKYLFTIKEEAPDMIFFQSVNSDILQPKVRIIPLSVIEISEHRIISYYLSESAINMYSIYPQSGTAVYSQTSTFKNANKDVSSTYFAKCLVRQSDN